MSGRDPNGLAQAEWAVLALIAEKPTHGWALGTVLQPGGEVGQIWSGDRQRIYRALRMLGRMGLIEAAALEAGEGPHRAIYRISPAGRARLDAWLAEPVEHVREIHSTFMLKLVFLQRAGIDPIPLLTAQRALLVASVASLEHKLAGLGPGEKPHLRLRLKTTDAVIDFIDESCNAYAASAPAPVRRIGSTSTRG